MLFEIPNIKLEHSFLWLFMEQNIWIPPYLFVSYDAQQVFFSVHICKTVIFTAHMTQSIYSRFYAVFTNTSFLYGVPIKSVNLR